VSPTVADEPLLDNAVWYALRGPQAPLAQASASGRALRFDPEVSPFGAVDTLDDKAWAEQADLVGPEGLAVLFRADVPPPPDGWTEVVRIPGLQMVAGELPPVPDLPVVPLAADDVPEMLALTALSEPGPFLARTIEMGRYLGVRREGRLVAMAGERLRLPGWAEISAVCTHPDARREGLGAAMTLHAAKGIRERGDRPFLHVVETNEKAIRLYLALGFRVRRSIDAVAAQWHGSGDPAAWTRKVAGHQDLRTGRTR
jgi:ribosomal protein S18 acetylase RimI-like enzyme